MPPSAAHNQTPAYLHQATSPDRPTGSIMEKTGTYQPSCSDGIPGSAPVDQTYLAGVARKTLTQKTTVSGYTQQVASQPPWGAKSFENIPSYNAFLSENAITYFEAPPAQQGLLPPLCKRSVTLPKSSAAHILLRILRADTIRLILILMRLRDLIPSHVADNLGIR